MIDHHAKNGKNGRMEFNPYAAPKAQVLQATPQAEVERMLHINTEATIKSVGVLYYLGAFALISFGGMALLGALMNGETAAWLVGAFVLALGVAHGMTAYGLRRLKGWARIPTIALSCIGLLGFPLGTLINAYILVKLLGQQGKFVMTPEYHQIIEATPHVKRKTSIVVWVLLILLLIILIGIIAAIATGK